MMNSADLKKVWENNRQLREEVEEHYIESEMSYVEEILNEITPACRDWSIGFYSYNYLQVWDYKGFLEGCISATGDYGLLREEDKEKAHKLKIRWNPKIGSYVKLNGYTLKITDCVKM